MKIKLRLYDVNKYSKDSLVYKTLTYDEVKNIEVSYIPRCIMMELTDEDGIDDCNQYLRLTFTDGEHSTFRNSYVDIKIEEN